MSIVPSTVIGATDAANYQRICHECIRFSAFVVDDDECDRGVHGTNAVSYTHLSEILYGLSMPALLSKPIS